MIRDNPDSPLPCNSGIFPKSYWDPFFHFRARSLLKAIGLPWEPNRMHVRIDLGVL